jgi:hypothetical protein
MEEIPSEIDSWGQQSEKIRLGEAIRREQDRQARGVEAHFLVGH